MCLWRLILIWLHFQRWFSVTDMSNFDPKSREWPLRLTFSFVHQLNVRFLWSEYDENYLQYETKENNWKKTLKLSMKTQYLKICATKYSHRFLIVTTENSSGTYFITFTGAFLKNAPESRTTCFTNFLEAILLFWSCDSHLTNGMV